MITCSISKQKKISNSIVSTYKTVSMVTQYLINFEEIFTQQGGYQGHNHSEASRKGTKLENVQYEQINANLTQY